MSENRLNEDIVESVKNDVFRQLKVKLTDDDPIFSLALLNKQIAEQISTNIIAAISVIPTQLDNKLQDRINEIGIIAQKLDEEVQAEATKLTEKIREDTERTASAVIDKLHAAINDDIGEGLRRINTAAVEVERASTDSGNFKWLITALVFGAIFSFASGFLGTSLWNSIYLDAANAKVRSYEKLIADQANAKDALIRTLPKNQADKAAKAYDDFLDHKGNAKNN